MFQSTPPRGGRRSLCAGLTHLRKFQSTPPRGGRQLCRYGHYKQRYVSIHAPARGATTALIARR